MPNPTADDVPNFLFQVSAPIDFKDEGRKGKPLEYVTRFRVTGAGTVRVRLKLPREGHSNETLVLVAGQTVDAKVAAFEAIDAGCVPITVSR